MELTTAMDGINHMSELERVMKAFGTKAIVPVKKGTSKPKQTEAEKLAEALKQFKKG